MSNCIEFTPINTGITLKIPVYRSKYVYDQRFKRGDIVKWSNGFGRQEYGHVEDVNVNGALTVIADEDGRYVGLSCNHTPGLMSTTLKELIANRERLKKSK